MDTFEQPAPPHLSRAQVRKLLGCIDRKGDKLLIQMGLVLGCRVSEICNLRLSMVRGQIVRLWDEKKDLFRDAVIDRATADLLNDYLQSEWKAKPHRPHMLFYFSTRTANRILKRYAAKAGIPEDLAHWHVLRHTHVFQSMDSGVTIGYLCAQTGDSPNTVINVYGKPSTQARIETLERNAFWRD